MNTDDIHSVMKAEPRFLGVKTRDHIPCLNENLPASFIMNTDDCRRPGRHWLAIYVNGNGSGIYFDSLGEQMPKDMIEFMDVHCKSWVYNQIKLQHDATDVCGLYAILFSVAMLNNVTPHSFFAKFTSVPMVNDVLVGALYESYVKIL